MKHIQICNKNNKQSPFFELTLVTNFDVDDKYEIYVDSYHIIFQGILNKPTLCARHTGRY